MINYETRQDGDVTFATFTREGTYFEVPTVAGQTEEEIQATIQTSLDTYDLIQEMKGD